MGKREGEEKRGTKGYNKQHVLIFCSGAKASEERHGENERARDDQGNGYRLVGKQEFRSEEGMDAQTNQSEASELFFFFVMCRGGVKLNFIKTNN